MKKVLVLILYGVLLSNPILCQTKIKIGDKEVKPERVDSSKFTLSGKWKIIYRTYVAERENTSEILPLESLNEQLYIQRKTQGELIYNRYITFSDSIYIAYCSLLPKLIVAPKFVKSYCRIDANEKISDPRWGDQNLLMIDILCPMFNDEDNQSAFTVFVLTTDLIVINYDNSSTFLQRVKDIQEKASTWPKDDKGYYVLEMKGSTDFEILVRDHSGFLQMKYELSGKHGIKYNYIDNKFNNNCDNTKTKVLFTTRNKIVSYPLETKINLKDLAGDIIEVNIGTENQNTKWLVRWKFTKQ